MSDLVSFAEALTASEADEVRTSILATFAEQGVQAGGWGPFSVQRGLLEVDSRFISTEQKIRATLAAAGYLDTAAVAGDDWVDALALGFFTLRRAPATNAVHRFVLTNNGGVAQSLSANARIDTDPGGLRFRVQSATSVPGGIGATADVTVVCDTAGTVGNIPTGTTFKWVGSGLPGVAISNPAIGTTGTSLLASGADAEATSSVIQRCRGYWATNSAGGARIGVAKWIADAFTEAGITGNPITRYAVDDENPNGPGSSDFYFANDAGPATADELAVLDPFFLERQTLGAGLWRVRAATVHDVETSGTLFVIGNPNALADADAALAALARAQQIGSTIYRVAIFQALLTVPGLYNATLTTPAADVVLDKGEVPAFPASFLLG